ncbi:alpha/beta hydrolase [soil metagenome]
MRQLAAHAAPRRIIDTADGPLAVLDTGPDTGSGRPPVLFVPGFTGSKEDFAPLIDPLCRAGFRVLALDQRGQFESPGVDDASAYTVAALAADLLAVADDLVGPRQRVHLCGHSFGGLVGRAAVLARPAQFASLALIASGPDRLVGPRADRLANLAPLLDQGGLARVYDVMEQLAVDDPSWGEVSEQMRAFLRHRFLTSSEAALRGMAEAMLTEPDRVAQLAATGVPVLVAHSERDDAWTPQAQAEMATRLGARHVVIADALHSPVVENPDAVLAALLDFWTA